MAVYIDPMIDWRKRVGRAGPFWCHVIADRVDELHAFAAKIGMKLEWFEKKSSFPHYNIGTDALRARAIAAGAVEVSRNDFVRHMRRIRAAGGAAGFGKPKSSTRPREAR